jgi:hypothetical protein
MFTKKFTNDTNKKQNTKLINFVQKFVCKMFRYSSAFTQQSRKNLACKDKFLQTFYKQSRFLQKSLQIVQTLHKNTNNTNIMLM